MSNIHIRNGWGISFLVSLLLKEDVGKEGGSGLASKGRRFYHLPSALGQKLEISCFILSFLLFLSFFPSLSFLIASVNISIFLCCILLLTPVFLFFPCAFLSPLHSSHKDFLPSSEFASFLALPSLLL